MKFNCDYCRKYWEFMNEPYFHDLRSKHETATQGLTLFCPACRVPEKRRREWIKGKKVVK